MIILLMLIFLVAAPTMLKLAHGRQWAELVVYSGLIALSVGISSAVALGLEVPPFFTILGKLVATTYERLRAVFI